MKTATSLASLVCMIVVPAYSYKALCHTGSSIMSSSRGYATSMYDKLGPLKLEKKHYANFETVGALSSSIGRTKAGCVSLTSENSLSRFGSASEKITPDNTRMYDGYDLVNFTLDYHTIKGWSEGSATSADKERSFKETIGRCFDNFHKTYPGVTLTFTNSTPVREPYWESSGTPEKAYNSVVSAVSRWAGDVCKLKNVPFVDLNGFCARNGIKPGGDGRHFSTEDRFKQGVFVGTEILRMVSGQTTLRHGPIVANGRVSSPKTGLCLIPQSMSASENSRFFHVNGAVLSVSPGERSSRLRTGVQALR